MKKKIYLSSPGLICCAGQEKHELYESCLTGNQKGIVQTELQNSCGKKFPAGLITCEPTKVKFTKQLPPAYTGETKIIRIIDAAVEQIRAEIERAIAAYGREKIGVYLGSCDNGSEGSLIAHKFFLANNAFPDDYDLRYQSASFPAEYIAEKFGLSGPVFTLATACASGASAIIRGAELIRGGVCSAVIVGGADIVSETVLSGFHALEAVSDELTNPFSKNRKGINLGEGAAFFLLDTAENYAVELLGTGESADAYHMTAPSADGPARAMKAALCDAQMVPEQIDYINLHGTGTQLNDKAESLALEAVFKKIPPVSSTKPITGHTLGAAGALEAAICWSVLTERRGFPVHCWDGIRDEEISVVPGNSGERHPSICMSNSFAFGGCNASLILGRNIQ
jgi:3-oxoacyl-[acyl-carrier-protein] synthase-1